MPDEGSLLPETYFYSKGDSRQSLIDRMQKNMKELSHRLWKERSTHSNFSSLTEAINLASIVEKETGKKEERFHVASVFINRLQLGMRLQSDPTVIYGITMGQFNLGRRLTRKDLRSYSPFNTYLISGLPPTPISNPGVQSIIAVLNPKKSKDLYFVADGYGGHRFSETLEKHNANVRKWRKIRDNKKE